MRAWLNRLWAEVNEMPGPVWVFGAWAVIRSIKWMLYVLPGWIPIGVSMDCSSLWMTIGTLVGMLVGQLLPLWALWALLKKKPYAVSLTSLYIGMKGVAMLVALVAMTVQWANPASEWAEIQCLDRGPLYVVWLALCGAFLLYMERSEPVAQIFQVEQRRRVPGFWVVGFVAFAAIVLLGQ